MTDTTLAQRRETPERIWADRDAETNEKQWFSIEGMGIEYVRADIAEHMRTELSNRTMAYGVIHSEWKQEKLRADAKDAEIARLTAANKALEADNERLNRLATDRRYMLDAFRNMLGPTALVVAAMWEQTGVQRVHFSWGPDAHKMDGEQRAQFILDMEKLPTRLTDPGEIDGPARSYLSSKEDGR